MHISEINKLTKELYDDSLKIKVYEDNSDPRSITKIKSRHSIETDLKELSKKVTTVADNLHIVVDALEQEHKDPSFDTALKIMMPDGERVTPFAIVPTGFKISDEKIQPQALQSLFHLLNAMFRFDLHEDTKQLSEDIFRNIFYKLPNIGAPLSLQRKIKAPLSFLIHSKGVLANDHMSNVFRGVRALSQSCREFFGLSSSPDLN